MYHNKLYFGTVNIVYHFPTKRKNKPLPRNLRGDKRPSQVVIHNIFIFKYTFDGLYCTIRNTQTDTDKLKITTLSKSKQPQHTLTRTEYK